MQRNYANKMIAASEVVTNLGTIVPILPATERQARHAYRLIDAAEVVGNVSNWTQNIAGTESQARPLTQLEPGDQPVVWQRAVESAPNT